MLGFVEVKVRVRAGLVGVWVEAEGQGHELLNPS